MIKLEMTEMKEMMSLVPMENILWVSKNKKSGECSVYVREWGEVLVTESTLNRYLKLKELEMLKNMNIPVNVISSETGRIYEFATVKMNQIVLMESDNTVKNNRRIVLAHNLYEDMSLAINQEFVKYVDKYFENNLEDLNNSEFEISDFDAPIEI